MWPTEENRRVWDEIHRRRAEETARWRGLPEAVRGALSDLEGKHLLHLPCGTGEATAELIGLGALVTGIDPWEELLAVARRNAPGAALFQADLHELPLQFRRGRFDLVYSGEGTLAALRELEPWATAAAAALRPGGELLLHDWHPVAVCVEPIGLRWRESYFEPPLWRIGQIVGSVAAAGLVVRTLDELPPAEEGPSRLDPRLPAGLLLRATKPSAERRERSRTSRSAAT